MDHDYIEKAKDYYWDHPDHVEGLRSANRFRIKPDLPSELKKPELWTGANWNWFFAMMGELGG